MSTATDNLKVRAVIHQVVNDPQYKAVSAVPLISLPQIGLLCLTLILIFGGMYLASRGVSLWLLYPFLVFGFYTSFTTIHDSTHRALSSNKYLNDFMGTLAGNLLLPFITIDTYRYIHLSHHRYVGDKDLDPDEAMVGIPTHYFPIGYLALFLYEYFAFGWLLTKAWKRTPASIRRAMTITGICNITFHVVMFSSPYWYEYLMWFVIPNRLGVGVTTYFFAHLPHPEGVHWQEHPFQATYSLIGNKLTKLVLWGQASHSIHHFLPHVPWYKYHQVWDLANGVFRQQNIPERPIFSFPDPEFKDRMVPQSEALLVARVVGVEAVAENIKSYTLAPLEGETFPPFTAGAHITLCLPSGKRRSYSLVNPSYEENRYQIAVKLEANGRGGSKEVHETLTTGSTLQLVPPSNNFVLYENVQRYILIAGGIGITPLLSMAHQLAALDKHFELHICAKDAAQIPFQYELQHWSFAPNVEIHLDKNGRSSMDTAQVLARPDEQTLLYLCGPAGFSAWVRQEAAQCGWSADRIQEEQFAAAPASISENQPFEVVFHESGQTITVEKDQSIIDAMLLHNIPVEYTCLQGTCGTCITPVVDGEVEHRDAVLSVEEKQAGDRICLCVSRAKGERIVLGR